MKRHGLLLILVACAGPASTKTIEPPGVPQDDNGFVLSRAPTANRDVRPEFPIHIEGRWWSFRADYLNLSEAECRQRDAAFGENGPVAKFWDEQTAIEAVSIWSALCNECHGGRRKLQDALKMRPPPEDWGRGAGLFFGRERRYQEIYTVVFNGGPDQDGKPSEMPDWGRRMSREQIWSLIYFIEYQSGGVKGRFPPSLYPREPDGL